ncbi:MAG: dicarboxylate/amino acid:cation symporter [Myxococcota bacterium]
MQLYTKILIGMAVGVVLGFLVGPNSSILPHDGVKLLPTATVVAAPEANAASVPFSTGIRQARIISRQGTTADGADQWFQVAWTVTTADILRFKGAREAKEPSSATPALPAKGATLEGWVENVAPAVATYSRTGEMLVGATEWLGRLFLALIKMVVVPLVFFSLTVGVASLGDFRRLGRLGGRTIGLFTGTTILALVIGVGLANLFQPGKLLDEGDRQRLLASYEGAATSTVDRAAEAPTFTDQVIAIVPTNPFGSLARGEMLQIIFFALMFGVALTLLDERRSKPVVSLLDYANEAMVMLVHIAMKLAPFGVAALLFKVVGSTGLSVLTALGVYALVVIAGLSLHLAITYGAIVRFGARLPFTRFLGAIKPAVMLAFSTSSSSATLPVTKECVEDNMNVSPAVSSFVVPLGATINMDGTALYQGVAAIFIAQIYGLDLTLADQVTIVTSATLASVGAAGVPGAGMITLAMVLTAVGVPTEGLALVLGVDRLLDMFRTATNVVGDSSATVMMARLEGDPLAFLTPEQDRDNPKKGFETRLEDPPRPVVAEVQEEA